MKNVPKTIYLQVDADGERPEDFEMLSGVSWCQDRIYKTDLQYTLAEPKTAVQLKAVPLFRLDSVQDWVKNSQIRLEKYRKPGDGFEKCRILYIDQGGHVCLTGDDFRDAESNNRFPVIAYRCVTSNQI